MKIEAYILLALALINAGMAGYQFCAGQIPLVALSLVACLMSLASSEINRLQ